MGPASERIPLLQYADDTLVFIRTKKIVAKKVAEILKQYGREAGQHANLSKPALLFSSGTTCDETRMVKHYLGIPKVSSGLTNLGEPIEVRNSQPRTTAFLLSKMQKHIHSWRGVGLSLAEKSSCNMF